jgi:ElaB/YqjD/DUF883 family membrane-anchored ribosome-binding protein
MATSVENPYGAATGMNDTSSTPPGAASTERGRGDPLARVVQAAHATVDRLAESAAPRVRHLQESAASAKEAVHARAERAREMGDEWTESLRCTVRENPLTAVTAALVLGLLLARLTQR